MSEETKLLAEITEICTEGQWTDGSGHLWGLISRIAAVAKKASAPAAGGEDIDPQRIHVTGSGQAYVFEPHINPDGSEDAREVPLAFAGWSEKKDRRVSGVKTRRVAGSATYAGPFRREAFADRRAQAGAGVLTAEEHDFLLVLCSMIRRAISDDPANRLLAITRRLTAQGGSDV